MEGVITRSKSSRKKDDASKSKSHKSGSKSSVTSSSKRSETSSVLKARAAARKAKLQVEMKALKQKELLKREELILRQPREEQERELRQDIEEKQRALQQSIEEVEEQQPALEKSREEEIRKLLIQSQREKWEIMNCKRILQKELDIKCAAIESDIIDKISERSFSVSGRSKHKASTKFQLEPSTSKLEVPSTRNLKLFLLLYLHLCPSNGTPLINQRSK